MLNPLRRTAQVVLVLSIASTSSQGLAWPSVQNEALRGAAYIVDQQGVNGSFFDLPADGTAEALGVVAAVAPLNDAVPKALDLLKREGPDRAKLQAAYAGRISMGLASSGAEPRNFHGFDYAAIISSFYDPATGAYDPSNLYANALAVLGLAAAEVKVPPNAIDFFRVNQCPDGGFSFRMGCAEAADTDTTAMVLMALDGHGSPPSDLTIMRARSFLSRTQTSTGAFKQRPYLVTDKPNANSTGLALSVIAALGEAPDSEDWVKEGNDALTALKRFQLPSGAFRLYEGDSRPNSYATVQAVPGLAGLSYPMKPRSALTTHGDLRQPPDVKIPGSASGQVHDVMVPSTGSLPQTPGSANEDPSVDEAHASALSIPSQQETKRSVPYLLAGLLAGLTSVLTFGVFFRQRGWIRSLKGTKA